MFTDGELEFGGWFLSDAAIEDEQSASACLYDLYPAHVWHQSRFIRGSTKETFEVKHND